MDSRTIDDSGVQSVFDAYPEPVRTKLMGLRRLLLDVADEASGVGEVEETLKWGQISYVTRKPRSGTTIRIDRYHDQTQQVALFVHCQTTLVDTFRQMHPDAFSYDGNRAVIYDDLDDDQVELVKDFIALALTYHQR